VIRINDQQFWLYAAANPQMNELRHLWLSSTTTTALTELFLNELRERHDVKSAVFLVDGAKPLNDSCCCHGLDFRCERHGNRNSVERVFRDMKHITASLSNFFSNVEAEIANEWPRSFAFVWNQLI